MFNIFKKKESPGGKSIKKPKTILCVPGNWNDRTEIVTAIAESNLNEFLLAGMVLLNLKTNKVFELEICERDPRMKASFGVAAKVNRVSEAFLNEINQHKFVIYISSETGDTHQHWAQLLNDFEESNLYQMFVLDSVNSGKGVTYSCGMHNLV